MNRRKKYRISAEETKMAENESTEEEDKIQYFL